MKGEMLYRWSVIQPGEESASPPYKPEGVYCVFSNWAYYEKPGEDGRGKVWLVRDEQAEADAALGKLVRALPLDYALAHYLGKWVVEDGDYCVVSEGDTPEAAIAALEVGNENV